MYLNYALNGNVLVEWWWLLVAALYENYYSAIYDFAGLKGHQGPDTQKTFRKN